MGPLALGGANEIDENLALVIGLLALSGVSQAQFSSTWTAVSDYDFRGFAERDRTRHCKAAPTTRSVTPAFRSARGRRTSTSTAADGDIELDLYLATSARSTTRSRGRRASRVTTTRLDDDIGEYLEVYVGFNAGNFSFKQWYSDDFYDSSDSAEYTEVNYTQPFSDKLSLALHAGYAWGDDWETGADEHVRLRRAGQLHRRPLHALRASSLAPMPAVRRSQDRRRTTTSRASLLAS